MYWIWQLMTLNVLWVMSLGGWHCSVESSSVKQWKRKNICMAHNFMEGHRWENIVFKLASRLFTLIQCIWLFRNSNHNKALKTGKNHSWRLNNYTEGLDNKEFRCIMGEVPLHRIQHGSTSETRKQLSSLTQTTLIKRWMSECLVSFINLAYRQNRYCSDWSSCFWFCKSYLCCVCVLPPHSASWHFEWNICKSSNLYAQIWSAYSMVQMLAKIPACSTNTLTPKLDGSCLSCLNKPLSTLHSTQ